jgi:hypothetical protein
VTCNAFSAKVVPGISDCGANQPIVGFFSPSAEDRRALGEAGLDADLQEWLSAGDAPAYFGFGSTPGGVILDRPPAQMSGYGSSESSIMMPCCLSAGWQYVTVVRARRQPALLPGYPLWSVPCSRTSPFGASRWRGSAPARM